MLKRIIILTVIIGLFVFGIYYTGRGKEVQGLTGAAVTQIEKTVAAQNDEATAESDIQQRAKLENLNSDEIELNKETSSNSGNSAASGKLDVSIVVVNKTN